MGISDQVNEMMSTGSLSYERGKFELLGIRGVILPVRTLVYLYEEIYDQNQEQLFEMLFSVGYKHGKIAVDDIGRRNKISKQGFIDYIETANLMGMGIIEVEKCDFDSKQFRGTIKDSPLIEVFQDSKTLSEIDNPIHHFWRGVFHSFSEELFDAEIESEEKKCEYLGANKCVIECWVSE